jgi:hypothetical protein
MEFPEEIQRLINEYAKPITRPDWRKGSSIAKCNNHIKYVGNGYLINVFYKQLVNDNGFDLDEKLIPSGKHFEENYYISLYENFFTIYC